MPVKYWNNTTKYSITIWAIYKLGLFSNATDYLHEKNQVYKCYNI